MHDEPRQDATSPDQYTLSIEDALIRYEHAGHPRTVRSIQRYCAKGDLDCLRQQTTFGDKFMITPQSVARHISQIVELASATHRGLPRPDATPVAAQNVSLTAASVPLTSPDVPRQDATGRASTEPPAADNRHIELLERENAFLRDQISVKDAQITELGVRARETNILSKGLQDLFLALNPARPETHARPSADPMSGSIH